MRAHLGSRILAAALTTAVAAGAQGQTIVADAGVGFSATALTGFATTGADMGGLRVTAFFADGTSAAGDWGLLGGGLWGVSLPSFSLTLGAGADTFSSPWSLLSGGPAGGPGLTRLTLNGAPGRTVFDYIDGPEHTPGSANGAPMSIFGGDLNGTIATYRNAVGVSGNLPLGDLYETLDISFQTPVGPNGLQFVTDTDNVGIRGTITQTPEPATYTMLAAGLGAIVLVARRRRTA